MKKREKKCADKNSIRKNRNNKIIPGCNIKKTKIKIQSANKSTKNSHQIVKSNFTKLINKDSPNKEFLKQKAFYDKLPKKQDNHLKNKFKNLNESEENKRKFLSSNFPNNKSKPTEKFDCTKLKSLFSVNEDQSSVPKCKIKKKNQINDDITKNIDTNENNEKKDCNKMHDRNSFQEKLVEKLQSSSFRILNEQMYTTASSETYKIYQENLDNFKIYHEGYNNQIENWPIHPLKSIATWLRKKPQNWIVADFGCGKATLAKDVKQKVFSIDLVALSPEVIECDMAHTPLESDSINVVVFCLSLMGTNLSEFILEANRVLLMRGVLKIADVESRFTNTKKFFKVMKSLGFECIHKNQKQYFWMFDFIKIKNVKLKPDTPNLNLAPCIYKKR